MPVFEPLRDQERIGRHLYDSLIAAMRIHLRSLHAALSRPLCKSNDAAGTVFIFLKFCIINYLASCLFNCSPACRSTKSEETRC